MAKQPVKDASFRTYPFQEAAGSPWRWRVDRLDPDPGGRTFGTKPEAKKRTIEVVTEAVKAGYRVTAEFIDQTGGGHRAVYGPDGSMIESTIIPATGDLGPRCSELPRGTKGEGPGGIAALKRRRTLAARGTWPSLFDALKEGMVKIVADGSLVPAGSRRLGVIADLNDWNYVAGRLLMRYPSDAIGKFPASWQPGAQGKGNTIPDNQRSAPQVMERVRAAIDGKPAKPTKPPRQPSKPRPPRPPRVEAPAAPSPTVAAPVKPPRQPSKPRPPRPPRQPQAAAPAPASPAKPPVIVQSSNRPPVIVVAAPPTAMQPVAPPAPAPVNVLPSGQVEHTGRTGRTGRTGSASGVSNQPAGSLGGAAGGDAMPSALPEAGLMGIAGALGIL